jgi:hypothetical protein
MLRKTRMQVIAMQTTDIKTSAHELIDRLPEGLSWLITLSSALR